MVKNRSNEPKPKSLIEIMRDAHAGISLPVSDGFAHISFDKNERDEMQMRVEFLGDEGYSREAAELPAEDVVKVGKFIEDLKTVRLQDYAKTV